MVCIHVSVSVNVLNGTVHVAQAKLNCMAFSMSDFNILRPVGSHGNLELISSVKVLL